MTLQNILDQLKGVKKNGSGWMALCPCHTDKNPSLSIKQGDNGGTLLNCFAGCKYEDIAKELGLNNEQKKTDNEKQMYNYGNHRKIKVKKTNGDKTFYWQHRKNGQWAKGYGDTQPGLYREQEIKTAKTVWLPEGEKDADSLAARGLPATTFPTVPKEIPSRYIEPLKGKLVYILSDNDDKGRRERDQKKETLQKAGIKFKVVDLPGLPKKGDITDWFNVGHTREEFLKLAESAPLHAPHLRTKKLSDVESIDIQWLWQNKIPRGMISLLVGNPGVGKSFLSLYIAAQITTGRPLADAEQKTDKGSVVMFVDEESLEYAVKPRLEKQKADCSKIYTFDGVDLTEGKIDNFSLTEHLRLLDELLDGIGDVKLIIFDPITAYLRGVDTNNNAEVRSAMIGLQTLAQRKNITVLGISHFSKKADLDAIYRTLGSTAFTAASRSVWAVIDDENSADRKFFMPVKANYSVKPQGLAYSIIDGAVAFSDETIEGDIDSKMQNRKNMQKGEKVQEAEEFLMEHLKYNSVPSSEIKQAAEEQGISRSSLNKAKKELNVKSSRSGFADDGGWMMKLPEEKEE